MEYQLYKNIISNPDICNGKYTIQHTRITVQTIMELIFAGENDEAIIHSYPRLTQLDIETCKEFTAQLLENPTFIKPLRATG